MSDLLSDPRAIDLLSADPDAVSALAGNFRLIAGEARGTAAGLRGAQHDATWTGAAADAFRSTVGQLPGQLDNVQSSYQVVAGALDAYEGELETVKAAFQRVAQQLDSARSGLSGAQGQLSSAQWQLSSAISAPHATGHTPAVQNAHDAVQTAAGAVGRLQAEVGDFQAQGFSLLDRFQSARSTCQGRVSSACSAAPHQSWWDHALHDVDNWMHDSGHFLVGVGKGIWDGVTGLPGAVVAFVEHPSWKTFAKLAEDVAITASVVLLVTGVGELLLPEDAAAAGLLASTGEAADTVATVANAAGVDAEGGQAADDAVHGHYAAALDDLANAGIDAAAGAAPELGDMLPASRAAEEAEDSASALGDYKSAIDSGATPAQALNAMTSEDRKLVLEGAGLESGTIKDLSADERAKFLENLADPEKIAEKAETSAELAKIEALPARAAVNFAQDHFVLEPVGDYGKDKVAEALGVGCGS